MLGTVLSVSPSEVLDPLPDEETESPGSSKRCPWSLTDKCLMSVFKPGSLMFRSRGPPPYTVSPQGISCLSRRGQARSRNGRENIQKEVK